MVIENRFPNNALQVFHPSISFEQKWTLLLKVVDQDKARELVERLKSCAMGFIPTAVAVSNVGEL